MSSHDKDHVDRVVALAIYIAKKEGGNLEIIKTAAKLHDIARDYNNHARKGAKIAEKILKDEGYPEDFIKEVVHCIEAHSFSSGIKPKTLEAKILSDADKLDAMGAIGIARAFMYSGEKGRSIEETLRHFEKKLLKLKDCIETRTGLELAENRHKFLLEFYKELRNELNFIKKIKNDYFNELL